MKTTIYVLIMTVLLMNCTKTNSPHIETGQEWLYVGNVENPYKKPDSTVFTVLDVDRGQVIYKSSDGDIFSISEKYFLLLTKCVSCE